MSARDGLGSEMRQLMRARRNLTTRLIDIVEQREELMAEPKVSRYVRLHTDEQVARDELQRVEKRILELVDLQEELT